MFYDTLFQLTFIYFKIFMILVLDDQNKMKMYHWNLAQP